MKKLSADFADHIEGEALNLCNCWRIIRADGVVLGFSDHDHDLVFDGITHEALSGFEASEVEESTGINAESHDLEGALQSEKLTREDILARRYDGAKIEHYIVNWSNPDEHQLMRTLLLGEISAEDGIFRGEARALTALLDQTSHRRFEKICSADLGDEACRIDLVSLTKTATVSAIISQDTIEITGLNNAPLAKYRGGKCVFKSGENAGHHVEIAEHLSPESGSGGAILRLWETPPDLPAIGDRLELTPGCDKQFSTCRKKFANAVNFQGFPHMPGTDFAVSYAGNGHEHNGEALFLDD